MAPAVSDNPSAQRFELRDDDQLLGWLDYRPAGTIVILAHTEVDAAQGSIHRHPDLARFVDPSLRSQFVRP